MLYFSVPEFTSLSSEQKSIRAFFSESCVSSSNTARTFELDNSVPAKLKSYVSYGFRLLNLIRHYSPVPFTVSSFYRSSELNKLVGGVPGSSHVKGLAFDIVSKNLDDLLVLSLYISKNAKFFGITYFEINPKKLYIHISYSFNYVENIIVYS